MAGARAMMRYRRTRASTTEAAAGIGSTIGKSWVGDDSNGNQQAGYGNMQYNNNSAPNAANTGGSNRMFFQGSGNGAGGKGQPSSSLPHTGAQQDGTSFNNRKV